MVKLNEILDIEALAEHVKAGNINATRHPREPLTIYGYSKVCQFQHGWDHETSTCRGLIVHDDGTIVARPFPKFQNYGETAVPKFALTTPPVVTEKLDGSLGIVHRVPSGHHAVATRGSFSSDQAIWASGWLADNYPEFSQPDDITTLVEIIYPQNRIVVDYGDRAELVLLGAIDNTTGADIPLWAVEWWDGPRAKQYTGLGGMDHVHRYIMECDRAGTEDEGIVAAWYKPDAPAFRLKTKGVDYVRLHRIITGINSKRVWEVMAAGGDFAEIIDNVPDEFYGWVKGVRATLQGEFNAIEDVAYHEFGVICLNTPDGDRKAFAGQAKKTTYPGLVFSLLDGKDIAPTIWAMVKPKAEKPFADPEG